MKLFKKSIGILLPVIIAVVAISCDQQQVNPNETVSLSEQELNFSTVETESISMSARDSNALAVFSFNNAVDGFAFQGRFRAFRDATDSLRSLKFAGGVVDTISNRKFRLVGSSSPRGRVITLNILQRNGDKLFTFARGRFVPDQGPRRGIRGTAVIDSAGVVKRQLWTARRVRPTGSK